MAQPKPWSHDQSRDLDFCQRILTIILTIGPLGILKSLIQLSQPTTLVINSKIENKKLSHQNIIGFNCSYVINYFNW